MRPPALAAWIFTAWALAAAPAAAQPTAERADALFAEGLQLADRGYHTRAAARFRESLEAHPSDRARYHLARALAARGRVAEAAALLRRVVLGDAPDLLVRDAAAELLRRVERRVATLRVTVEGPLDGRLLLLNEEPLDLDRARAGVPVDPGRHVVVVVERTGVVLARRTVRLRRGGEADVRLEPPPSPSAVALAAGGREPVAVDEAPVTSRWWFWGGIGAAAVAAAVTGIVLAASSGRPEPAPGDLGPIHVGAGR